MNKPVLILPQLDVTASKNFTLVELPSVYVCLDRSGWAMDCAKSGRFMFDETEIVSEFTTFSPGKVRRLGWEHLLSEGYQWLPAYKIADEVCQSGPVQYDFDFLRAKPKASGGVLRSRMAAASKNRACVAR